MVRNAVLMYRDDRKLQRRMIKCDIIQIIYGIFVMVRRKVEGLILDLTEVEGDCDVDALISSADKQQIANIVEVSEKSHDDYMNIFDKMCTGNCSKCGIGIYGERKCWRSEVVCGNCHIHLRNCGISTDFNIYIESVYGRGCAFCGQKEGRFHLDHINMFIKEHNVCEMLDRGHDEENIRNEIDKCQLLCISCHSIVTRYEQRAGFHNEKRVLTRIKRKYGVEVYEQKNLSLSSKYDEIMTEVYARIRALFQGR